MIIKSSKNLIRHGTNIKHYKKKNQKKLRNYQKKKEQKNQLYQIQSLKKSQPLEQNTNVIRQQSQKFQKEHQINVKDVETQLLLLKIVITYLTQKYITKYSYQMVAKILLRMPQLYALIVIDTHILVRKHIIKQRINNVVQNWYILLFRSSKLKKILAHKNTTFEIYKLINI